ncbi:methyltransferase domain-containing protein [Synechococcales cyanobacterium C]|uniref:Methyltransferase domain-containing protein n=1 Tax=Petrachloros mirabilis ULC683 TaxID=2781853 RepID=A0A8K1ZZF5_9CYAN|nr:methyltransferase domain-containing protein [Petrachloros mirabilis]NCJ07653.1 methyltransferase domain-containing protein [Petrachloros mirabilis ULC683]
MVIINSSSSSVNNLINKWLTTLQSNNKASEHDFEILDNSNISLDLERLWQLMDQVWDEMDCDNVNLDLKKISAYYQHPIWLLNGFFVEQHDVSLQHRHGIADWIVQTSLQRILDFGGGFGTLARIICDKVEQASVDIYEPYPSREALFLSQDYPRLRFVSDLDSGYDCLVSTDVLEHVPDPLALFAKMIAAVRRDGYLLIANHFYPSIKCHLPSTFHFRYSFDQFAEAMGLEKIGTCPHATHATIYQKVSEQPLNWRRIRSMEANSQLLFPWREFDSQHLGVWRARFKRLVTDPSGTFRRACLWLER